MPSTPTTQDGSAPNAGFKAKRESKQELAILEAFERCLDLDKSADAEWDTAVQGLFTGLDVDEDHLAQYQTQGTIHSLVKFGYFMLLFCSDLDVLGFVLAFPFYWTYDGLGSVLIKIVLVGFPCAFVFCLILNVYHYGWMRSGPESQEVEDEDCALPRVAEADDDYKKRTLERIAEETKELMTRPASPVKAQHIVPILRYQLLLYQPSPEDVEAMFRINTLSSFSLGVAQLVSMSFYLFVGGYPWNLAICINMFSQCVNWIVTLSYFFSPVANLMKDAMIICNLSTAVQHLLDSDTKQFLCLVKSAGAQKAKQIAEVPDKAQAKDKVENNVANRQAQRFRKQVQAELDLLEEEVLFDLSDLPDPYVGELRHRLYRKHLHLFSQL